MNLRGLDNVFCKDYGLGKWMCSSTTTSGESSKEIYQMCHVADVWMCVYMCVDVTMHDVWTESISLILTKIVLITLDIFIFSLKSVEYTKDRYVFLTMVEHDVDIYYLRKLYFFQKS